MSTLQELHLVANGSELVATAPTGSWFVELRRVRIDTPLLRTTGVGESCALLLSGTFDLRGGHTQWQSRGARKSEFEGRPVAVFLPPHTEFAADNGTGAILFVEARQPSALPATGRAALRQSPLLPLAGSGKSFDPTIGEWMPAESFPTAAESLPPRRIAQLQCGLVRVERVFAAEYKAMSLVVDEAVVQGGTAWDLADLPLPASATEALIYVRSDGKVTISLGNEAVTVQGESVVHATGAIGRLCIGASSAAAYAVVASTKQ